MYPRRDRVDLPERAHAGHPSATPSTHRQEDRSHRGGTARPTHHALSAVHGPSHGPCDVNAPFAHPYALPASLAFHSHHKTPSYVAEPNNHRSQRVPVETKPSRGTAFATKPSNARKPKLTSHLRFPKSPLPRPEHTLLFGSMGMAVNTGRYVLDQGGAAVGGGLLYGEDGYLLLEAIDDRFEPPQGRPKDRRRSESHAGTSRVPPPRAKRSASAPPGAPRLRPVDLPPMRD
ncbi:hypothetical protein K523DRAFT_360617 [Schizophyllum commune Tattone D]|nr:hypothetical protein K523DRAFT_360617 [Schizophyllum commune Tattone D]